MRRWLAKIIPVVLAVGMAGASTLCASVSHMKYRSGAGVAAGATAHSCCGKKALAGSDKSPSTPEKPCTLCDQAFWSAPGAAGKWAGKFLGPDQLAGVFVLMPAVHVPAGVGGEVQMGVPEHSPAPPAADLFHSKCSLVI
jgi:hypothetical protein